MKARGVPIALGTDGVSSNNNQDMFEEMKFAAVLHNGVTRNPLALLPQDVLAMATRRGPRPWAARPAASPRDTSPTSSWWTSPGPTSPPATA